MSFENKAYCYYKFSFPKTAQNPEPGTPADFYGQIFKSDNKDNVYYLRGMVYRRKLIWIDDKGIAGHVCHISEEMFSNVVKPASREEFNETFLNFIDSNQWLLYIDTMRDEAIKIPEIS